MKTKNKFTQNALSTFEAEYRTALEDYLRHGSEGALRRAYELGRRGIGEKKSLMDLVSLHHHALHAQLPRAKGAKLQQELLATAGEFLAEAVSLYQMAHLGVQDAIAALRRVNETMEEEIKRVAYAVHDEAGELLVAVHLAMADLARELPDAQKNRTAKIEELLLQVEAQLRRYSHELRPTLLDDLGWIPAIRFLAERVSKRANLDIRIESTVKGRFPAPIEIALYRIVQEALTNAAKHSQASRVRIRISQPKGMLNCAIEDNGVGFNAPAAQSTSGRKGLGLIVMQERLNGIGGTFAIESEPGQGTRLLIQLPAETLHASSHRVGG